MFLPYILGRASEGGFEESGVPRSGGDQDGGAFLSQARFEVSAARGESVASICCLGQAPIVAALSWASAPVMGRSLFCSWVFSYGAFVMFSGRVRSCICSLRVHMFERKVWFMSGG